MAGKNISESCDKIVDISIEEGSCRERNVSMAKSVPFRSVLSVLFEHSKLKVKSAHELSGPHSRSLSRFP